MGITLDAGELWCVGRRGPQGVMRTATNHPPPRRGKEGDRLSPALSQWHKPSLQQSHAMFYPALHPIFRRHMGLGLQTDAHCLAQWESASNISIIHTVHTCSSFLEKVRGIFCNFELSLAISLICSPPVMPVLQTHLSYFPQFLNNISY